MDAAVAEEAAGVRRCTPPAAGPGRGCRRAAVWIQPRSPDSHGLRAPRVAGVEPALEADVHRGVRCARPGRAPRGCRRRRGATGFSQKVGRPAVDAGDDQRGVGARWPRRSTSASMPAVKSVVRRRGTARGRAAAATRGPGRRRRRRRRSESTPSRACSVVAWKAPIRPVPASPIFMALPVLRRGGLPSVAVAGPPVHPLLQTWWFSRARRRRTWWFCRPGPAPAPGLTGRRRSRARRRPGRANPARGRVAP